MYRFTPCLKNRAPVRKVPLGTTTVPPPSFATLSINAWRAVVLDVLPSPTAPKLVIVKRLAPLAGTAAPMASSAATRICQRIFFIRVVNKKLLAGGSACPTASQRGSRNRGQNGYGTSTRPP